MIRPYFSRAQLTSDRLAALLVTVAPLAYFFPAVRGRIVISPDDGIIFNVPLRVAAANLISAGYLPLWNPYMFCGMPLHGAAQAGLLFPLNWFYLVFSAPAATNLMMLSTYMVAALGAYLYARGSGASVAGAALTSLIWQACGFLLGQIGHTNVEHTAALLPWLLWAIDRYADSGKRSRGVLLAAIVALQMFAGHQQTFAYALLVAISYAIVMSRAAKVSRTSYLWSLAFVGAGLGLAAVQILPTLELLRNSMRAQASYSFFTSFSLPPSFLWTFFAPYVFGGGDGQLFRAPYVGPAFFGEYVGYVGVGTIALASLAVFLKRDLRTKFWCVLALVGLLLAFGRFWPFRLYNLIYYTPVLGLFRVPARHLMEVEFALAVLGGRGLTAIAEAQNRAKMLRSVLVASAVVLGLTCLAVTVGRPANFQLGRTAPVSILRAPELFLPVVIAALTTWSLWIFARRGGRVRSMLLLVVVVVDLCLFGQSSGWRVSSPKSDFELWGTPATVALIRDQEALDKGTVDRAAPFRILTQERPFDPDRPAMPDAPAPAGGWTPSLQPDVYMMYGIENAAGYDGFGLARYSRLAGDMKVWGELTDAEQTLRGDGREIDLLNVRYLLTPSSAAATAGAANDTTTVPGSVASAFSEATQSYNGQRFGAEDLNLPAIAAGERLSFSGPPIEADHIALLTNLAWSEAVPNRTVVARVRLHASDGRAVDFDLLAGDHTSEWAYDRPDIQSHIKHSRAPVGTSYEVQDATATYQAHTYVSGFAIPVKTIVTGGEITVARIPRAPDLTMSVTRISLSDGERAFPLRREWIKKESAENTAQAAPTKDGDSSTAPRWQLLKQVEKVAVFENRRMLPRAWLASSELVVSEEAELSIIRSGKMPDGAPWRPLDTALVESETGIHSRKGDEPSGRSEVTLNEPNRVEVKTETTAPAILVLSANHYPGWRAYVDGQPTGVIRVNYNLRGVAVPAGNHVVTFVYRPKSVLIGLVISLLTLAVLVMWATSYWDRGRLARNGRSEQPISYQQPDKP